MYIKQLTNNNRLLKVLNTIVLYLKDKYPNFEVGLKCILMVNPYLLLCSYIT